MSTDEATKGIEALRDANTLPRDVARVAISQPLEAEKLLRMERIEVETRKQSQALFGDKELRIGGLVNDVRDLKLLVYRASWTIAGGVAVGGFFIAAAVTVVTILLTIATIFFAWLHR